MFDYLTKKFIWWGGYIFNCMNYFFTRLSGNLRGGKLNLITILDSKQYELDKIATRPEYSKRYSDFDAFSRDIAGILYETCKIGAVINPGGGSSGE